jgi:hypothetical protein
MLLFSLKLYAIPGRKGCVKMILAGKENMEKDSFSFMLTSSSYLFGFSN